MQLSLCERAALPVLLPSPLLALGTLPVFLRAEFAHNLIIERGMLDPILSLWLLLAASLMACWTPCLDRRDRVKDLFDFSAIIVEADLHVLRLLCLLLISVSFMIIQLA